MDKTEAAALCKKHLNRYVMAQTNDGMVIDGIVESVDEENVYLAVPASEAEMAAPAAMTMPNAMAAQAANNPHHNCGDHAYRAYGGYGAGYGGYGGYGGYPGYGYPGYGYGGYPGYGYPGYGFYGPRRRFRRFVLPLAALTALSLLPYF